MQLFHDRINFDFNDKLIQHVLMNNNPQIIQMIAKLPIPTKKLAKFIKKICYKTKKNKTTSELKLFYGLYIALSQRYSWHDYIGNINILVCIMYIINYQMEGGWKVLGDQLDDYLNKQNIYINADNFPISDIIKILKSIIYLLNDKYLMGIIFLINGTIQKREYFLLDPIKIPIDIQNKLFAIMSKLFCAYVSSSFQPYTEHYNKIPTILNILLNNIPLDISKKYNRFSIDIDEFINNDNNVSFK